MQLIILKQFAVEFSLEKQRTFLVGLAQFYFSEDIFACKFHVYCTCTIWERVRLNT